MIYFQHLRKFVRKMRFLFLAAVTVCFTFIPVALAVTPDPALVKAATAAGADRTNSLIDGAKKEGQLTFYTSAPVDDVIAVTSAFEKKYGVRVNVWRASSEKVLQRIVTEARSGRFDFDTADTNGPEMEALHREQLLQEVKSPYLKDLIPHAIRPHKEWVGTRLNVFAQAYNTNKIKKSELPKTYYDLLDPKWKGQLGIEAEDLDWFGAVMGELGEEKGMKLFRDIVAANGISVRKGHTLLTNLVVSGEVPLALTVYNYKAEQLKNKGAPIDWFVIPPAIARPNGSGVSRKAPHPNAAILFFDFMITDAQEILSKRDFVPVSKKIDSPLNKIPLKVVDSAIMLDDNDKWEKMYAEIITKQSR